MYDGVLAGLARPRVAGWRIGVVTNGYESVQTNTLTSTGIAGLVDGWAISGAEHSRKPDVRLFEIAATRAGARCCNGRMVGDGWMVGDSAADIVGGRAAGLRTVWLPHDRPWPADAPEPDHVVASAAAAVDLMLG